MNNNRNKPQIVTQQLALDRYLSSLLNAIPEADLDEDLPFALQQDEVAPTPLAELGSERTKTPATLVPMRQAVSRPEVSLESPSLEYQPVENPGKLHPLSVMPEWSQQEFQALFFKVEHLILATPLTELSRTIKIERKIGKIPGQPSWFLGLLDDQDVRVGVLDTMQLVFGKTRGSQRDLEQKPFQRILITKDQRWGLACDEILSIGRLQPDKVRWRTSRQKRPWLIGTVIDELTAIVDLQALVPHRRNK